VAAVACRGWTARAVPPSDASGLGAVRSKPQYKAAKGARFPLPGGLILLDFVWNFVWTTRRGGGLILVCAYSDDIDCRLLFT
jgi:hypothetical protein